MSLVADVQFGAPIMLLLLSPWLAARLFDGRAPTRTVATFHLLALLGMAALPLLLLACTALIRPGELAALANPHVIRAAQLAILALGAVYPLRVARAAVRVSRATARLAAQTTMTATETLPVPGGPAGYVLAADRPVAYALGGRAERVVVSQGLLALLDHQERDAVVAHEQAHVRLHHHRLLCFAQVVAAALGKAAPRPGGRTRRSNESWKRSPTRPRRGPWATAGSSPAPWRRPPSRPQPTARSPASAANATSPTGSSG